LDNFGNRDVERSEAVGPNPDAHRVFPRTENAHAADAGNAGERLVDVNVGVVRQKCRVKLAAWLGKNKHCKRRV